MAVSSHKNNNEEFIEETATISTSDTIIQTIEPEKSEPTFTLDIEDITSTESKSEEPLNIGIDYDHYFKFVDTDEVAPWAEEAMRWVVNREIIKGREENKIVPKKPATRQEVATMLYRFYKFLKESKEI